MALKLETERIRLRYLRKSDADYIYKYVRDPDIVQNTLLPHPYKQEHAWEFITLMTRARRRSKPNDIAFAIELLEIKTLIGIIGIHRINRVHNIAEIGFWLGKPFRGMGLVPEAVRLTLRHSFRYLNLERIYALVFTANKASCSVLMKCGFSLLGTMPKSHSLRGRDFNSYLFSILKREWRDESS